MLLVRVQQHDFLKMGQMQRTNFPTGAIQNVYECLVKLSHAFTLENFRVTKFTEHMHVFEQWKQIIYPI